MTNRIEIERYMGIRTATNPAYDGGGQRLYFLSNTTGHPQVWTTEPGVPWPKQVTFMKEHVSNVVGSPTAEHVIVEADMNGSERSQLYLMSPDGLELENLTNDPAHIYELGAWSPDGKRISYHTNKRNGRTFDVYLYNVETREHQLVHESDFTNHVGFFTPDGSKLLFARKTSNMNNDLYLLDLTSGETTLLTPHEGDSTFRPAAFSSDGDTLFLASDRDGEYIRAVALHLPTNTWVWLTDDHWDIESLSLSADGRYLSYTKNVSGTSLLYFAGVRSSANGQIELQRVEDVPDLPSGVITHPVWNPQRSQLAVTVSAPKFGTEVWTVNLETRSVERATYNAISGVPEETFVEPELISYKSFDGLDIPAFYFRPQNVEGPLPVLVHVHGGPEAQSRNGFNPYFQYFVRLGFAVLVPNVRGSAGYGRTYVHLDDVRKRMDSVADLAACVDWLVEYGNANREAIAVMGSSYGGFMTLAAVTHYPELWAAGVDIVGISNLRTFIENTSSYRRHVRESEYGTIEADGAFFDEISPIHHVDKIVAPMLIIHGANDPRVPVSEADQIVEALQQRNQPVEYLRFDDEGHGVVKLANRITTYSKVGDFLLEHLVQKV